MQSKKVTTKMTPNDYLKVNHIDPTMLKGYYYCLSCNFWFMNKDAFVITSERQTTCFCSECAISHEVGIGSIVLDVSMRGVEQTLYNLVSSYVPGDGIITLPQNQIERFKVTAVITKVSQSTTAFKYDVECTISGRIPDGFRINGNILPSVLSDISGFTTHIIVRGSAIRFELDTISSKSGINLLLGNDLDAIKYFSCAILMRPSVARKIRYGTDGKEISNTSISNMYDILFALIKGKYSVGKYNILLMI